MSLMSLPSATSISGRGSMLLSHVSPFVTVSHLATLDGVAVQTRTADSLVFIASFSKPLPIIIVDCLLLLVLKATRVQAPWNISFLQSPTKFSKTSDYHL